MWHKNMHMTKYHEMCWYDEMSCFLGANSKNTIKNTKMWSKSVYMAKCHDMCLHDEISRNVMFSRYKLQEHRNVTQQCPHDEYIYIYIYYLTVIYKLWVGYWGDKKCVFHEICHEIYNVFRRNSKQCETLCMITLTKSSLCEYK